MKTRRMDYHLHTSHSMDCERTMDSLCRRALALGLDEICVTDHIEPGHPQRELDIPPVWPNWQKDIAQCREKYPELILRAGIEIGDNAPIRESIYETLAPLKLDFHLLSLHLVKNEDPYNQSYFDGKDQLAAYRDYVEAKWESIRNYKDYDAVAHIGYVSKFAPFPKETRPLFYHHAPDLFDEMFKLMAREGKALEINTSGYLSMDRPIPGDDLIKRYLELGGEFFTFGSDSHRDDRVYLYVEEAKELVASLGGKWQCAFEQRQMKAYPLKP